jgi:hypothetical protein
MAVNVNEVKERTEVVAAKDQKTIYLNSDKYNKYAPIAQDMIISRLRQQFEAGTMSSDALSDLKVKTMYSVDPDTGQLTKPTDYMYFDAAYVNVFNVNKMGEQIVTTNPIDPVKDNELGNRLSSQVAPPTKQRPIIVDYGSYLQFYPYNVGQIELVYLKTPLTPYWNWTVSSNEEVYAASSGVGSNPNTGAAAGDSTNFELPYQFKDDLIWTICELLGVTVRQPDLVQAGQALNVRE